MYGGHHQYNQDYEYQGYEGYPGYEESYQGYEGYGYDGYGYDGYYDPRYYWQDAVAANEGSSSSPPPPAATPNPSAAGTPPSAAPVAGSGADMMNSSLDGAASPTNTRTEQEVLGEGTVGVECKPRSVGRDGTGAGAVRLPPIGGGGDTRAGAGVALTPRPASR